MMLHTKYQGSGPCGFRQEDFFHVFPIYAKVNNVAPRAGHYCPQGHNLNKLNRGSLGDATYQISRLQALWFQRRKYFHFSPRKPM